MNDLPTPGPDAALPRGREEEFITLLNAAHGRLVAYTTALVGNRHDAEDVLQRASLQMWRRFDDFRPGSDFVAWASTVAFYEARNFQRASARSRLRFSPELMETLAAERLDDLRQFDDRLTALQHCLQQLDEPNRRLLQEFYVQEADAAALAAQLGRATQTLYNRLHHLRRLLARCVESRLAEGST